MKKLLLIISANFFLNNAIAQALTGNWEGNLNVQSTAIPIVFHIKKDSVNALVATFDSPKQKAYNLACGEVILNEDSVIIMIPLIRGNYAGKLSVDKKQITGIWTQGGAALPLNITKSSDVVKVKEIKRPQTPKPPFGYGSQDIEYDNADKSIHYGATITNPDLEFPKATIKKYPAVILITGSGQQDRDETIFDHKPFAVIADHLTKKGIIVLRVDDRGIGKTTGNIKKATTADFAKDVEAGIAYLKTRNNVDGRKIGLIGHSEGGMIAPMIASHNSTIAFIVLLAGPGVKITTLMEQQNNDVAKTTGVSAKELEQFGPLYKNLVNAIIDEKDSSRAKEKGINIFRQWQRGKSAFLVKNTTGVTDEISLHNYVDAFVEQLQSPWFNFFMKFNPADHLSKVKCPVLALNGEKDIQVSSKPNLLAIKSSLSSNKKNKIMELPGLNHLFQHCVKCSIDEYADIEETFSEGALNIISDWIRKITK